MFIFITFFNLKTFGFEPKTFPLKEGHSTNRVLYSSFSCFCSYFYSFCLFLCIAQKSLNFCLAFSYSIVTTFAVALKLCFKVKTKATATAIVLLLLQKQ